jgi:hypothetical protein
LHLSTQDARKVPFRKSPSTSGALDPTTNWSNTADRCRRRAGGWVPADGAGTGGRTCDRCPRPPVAAARADQAGRPPAGRPRGPDARLRGGRGARTPACGATRAARGPGRPRRGPGAYRPVALWASGTSSRPSEGRGDPSVETTLSTFV